MSCRRRRRALCLLPMWWSCGRSERWPFHILWISILTISPVKHLLKGRDCIVYSSSIWCFASSLYDQHQLGASHRQLSIWHPPMLERPIQPSMSQPYWLKSCIHHHFQSGLAIQLSWPAGSPTSYFRHTECRSRTLVWKFQNSRV